MAIAHTFYFNDGPYLEALKGCVKGATTPESIVLLSGEGRTGKTQLCERLTQLLRKKGYRAIMLGADINSPELLRNFLARELDLPQSHNFARALEGSLVADSSENLVLIFDDAEQLSDTILLEIHRLSEVQQGDRRLINFVLCGEPNLARRLAQKTELKQLQLHITHRLQLAPMSAEATRQFVYSYANKTGNDALQLEAPALNYLYRACHGLPGPTLEVCRALMLRRAEKDENEPVQKQELVGLVKSLPSSSVIKRARVAEGLDLRHGLLPVALVVVVASLGLLYQQLLSPEVTTVQQSNTVIAQSTDTTSVFVDDDREQADSTESALLSDERSNEVSDNLASTNSDVVSGDPAAGQAPTGAAPAADTLAVEDEEATDSGLVLVSVQQLGIDQTAIAQPEYEPAAPETASAASAALELPANASMEQEPQGDNRNDVVEVAPAATGIERTVTTNTELEPISPPASSVTALNNVDDFATATSINEEIPEETTTEPDEEIAEPDTVALNGAASAASVRGAELPLLDQLSRSVSLWVDSWQAKDLEGYFDSYHEDYVPSYHESREQWATDRRRIIGSAREITMELSDFAVVDDENDEVEVQFWLRYDSSTYSDSTLKKLVLRPADDVWKIIEETNLLVRR